MVCRCVLGAIKYMMNQNILIARIVPVSWRKMTMKFVHALKVVVAYIGTETFGNVQIVTILKKISKIKQAKRNSFFFACFLLFTSRFYIYIGVYIPAD